MKGKKTTIQTKEIVGEFSYCSSDDETRMVKKPRNAVCQGRHKPITP